MAVHSRCLTIATFFLLILVISYFIAFKPFNLPFEDTLLSDLGKLENQYKISSNSFHTLNNATFGAIHIGKIIETIEIIQYDVSRPLPDVAQSIECVVLTKADPPYKVCITTKDPTAQRVKGKQVWEREIQVFIKQFYKENPGTAFLDVGMHIGLHALYATIIDKDVQVLAVEPFPESIITLHKATHLNNVQDRFKIIVGAVARKRGPIAFVGAYTWLKLATKADATNSFLVNAITINDLTPFLKGQKVLLKMDIESSECHVFANAEKIFAEVDIAAVIMEIVHTRNQGPCCFEAMLEFFKERNYKAYFFSNHPNPTVPLNYTDWRQWDLQHYENVYFKKFY